MFEKAQYDIAKKQAKEWLKEAIDKDSRQEIENLLTPGQEEALIEAFLRPLAFGTGGLREKMGVGRSCINRYTVALITQGLANYLHSHGKQPLRAVVAYDSRTESSTFAQVVSEVLSANEVESFTFSALRPTPLLSFAVRKLKASCGVVITASHNPKEYNGYKVYNPEGAQLVSPADTEVMSSVSAVESLSDVRFSPRADLHQLGEEIENAYLQSVCDTLSRFGLSRPRSPQIRIVYSSLHGTGITLLPQLMSRLGYDKKSFQVVKEQSTPDGNFPTVSSPNPEEASSLRLGIEQAVSTSSQIVMATDPDADRLGIAVRDTQGSFVSLSGNQTAVLILDFLLRHVPSPKRPYYVVKTIVTSELFREIANHYEINCYDTLTGFKYIAAEISKRATTHTFLCGVEESYGYLVGENVRDKDAVSTSAVVALMAEEATANDSNLLARLYDLYLRFGLYEEALTSITLSGVGASTEIANIMTNWRRSPPAQIGDQKLIRITDYQESLTKNLLTQQSKPTDLPKSNVLQFFGEKGAKVTLRPSGTEPKLKAYFSLRSPLTSLDELAQLQKKLQLDIQQIQIQLGLQPV